jgi:type IV pilus assembly protein PilW
MHSSELQQRHVIRPVHGGFSLIELMVGMLVSMICVLAIMSAFAVYEGHKRTTTSANDAMQNGSFTLYELERQVRTAGSGLINGSNYGLWGCPIQATTGGTAVMPTGSIPTAFSNWPTTIRAVPVLIQYGGATGPDVIGVISGNAAYQAFNITISTATSATDFTVGNNFGIVANDYLLAPLSNGNCALAQVSSLSGTTTVALSSTNSASGGVQTAQYAFDLGASPVFSLFGVDTTSNTLISYDLLQRTVNGGNAATPISDGIVQIKALYGIHDGTTAGQTANYIDKWVQPTGTWAISALTASTTAAATATSQIKAIRIAVVAQSRLPEQTSSLNTGSSYTTGKTSLTLFPDLSTAGLSYTITTLPQYRYRVYDTTIPVQNSMILSHF